MADVGESKLRQRMRPKPATPSKCGRKRQRIIQGDAIQDPIHPTNDAFEQASLPLTPSGADQRTTRAVPRPILVAETQVRLPKDVAGSAWAANVYYAHFLRVEESAEEVHGGVARRRQGNHRAAKQGEAVSAAMKEDQWNRVALREHRPDQRKGRTSSYQPSKAAPTRQVICTLLGSALQSRPSNLRGWIRSTNLFNSAGQQEDGDNSCEDELPLADLVEFASSDFAVLPYDSPLRSEAELRTTNVTPKSTDAASQDEELSPNSLYAASSLGQGLMQRILGTSRLLSPQGTLLFPVTPKSSLPVSEHLSHPPATQIVAQPGAILRFLIPISGRPLSGSSRTHWARNEHVVNAETAENEGSGARAEKVIIWTAEALRCFWDALTTLCKSGRLGHISVSARGSFACPKSSVPPSQETATGEMVVLYCDAPFVGDVRDFLGGITVSGPYRRKPLSAEAGVRLLLVDARGRALASL